MLGLLAIAVSGRLRRRAQDMANVNVAIEFDAEESQLSEIMDAVFAAVFDVTGSSPMLGLQVDGEHRDPDEPKSGAFE